MLHTRGQLLCQSRDHTGCALWKMAGLGSMRMNRPGPWLRNWR
jgi:hypothetical protein